jgi:hypothetical protein
MTANLLSFEAVQCWPPFLKLLFRSFDFFKKVFRSSDICFQAYFWSLDHSKQDLVSQSIGVTRNAQPSKHCTPLFSHYMMKKEEAHFATDYRRMFLIPHDIIVTSFCAHASRV